MFSPLAIVIHEQSFNGKPKAPAGAADTVAFGLPFNDIYVRYIDGAGTLNTYEGEVGLYYKDHSTLLANLCQIPAFSSAQSTALNKPRNRS